MSTKQHHYNHHIMRISKMDLARGPGDPLKRNLKMCA